jgi:Na+/melibiose symporter-like transporter
MLDVRLFRDARFSAASLVLTLSTFATFGTLLLLTQSLQFVVGQTPLQAGAALRPLVPTLLLGSIVAPCLSERLGPKQPVAIGLCIVASGVGILAFVQRESGYLPVAFILLIAGLGVGLAAAPAATSIMDALPVARAGVGSAVNDTTRQVGGALGVAVLGSVLSTVYRDALQQHAAAILGQSPPVLGAAVRDSIKACCRGPLDSSRGGRRLSWHGAVLAAGVVCLGALSWQQV